MKNEPIRVAQIVGKWLGGGVEATIMNYYRHINRNEVQFDFICDSDSTDIPYEEINRLGGKVILIPPYQKIFKYQKELSKVLKEGDYKIIHSHINTLSVFPLRVAKKVGVPVRIAHSHSTTNKKEWKKNLLKQVLKPFSKVYATHYVCCSELAGRWLFGDKTYDEGKVYLLNNAIDLDKFTYNENIRKAKREELGLKDEQIVIGHIGRFVAQKNHTFLIDVFYELQKKQKDAVLVLVGDGIKREEILEKCRLLNISEKVIYLGVRSDINNIMNSFDCFVLPSIYEGLGIVLIEAQATGLPCVFTNTVPQEANILTESNTILSLKDELQKWVDAIIKSKNIKIVSSKRKICNSGYDIKIEAKKLEKYYKKIVG